MNPSIASSHSLSATRMKSLVEDLDHEAWFAVPTGFDNNIAWNVGHTILVRRRILYARSNQPLGLPDAYGPLFLPGTSPKDWSENPDPQELIQLLEKYGAQVPADAEAGLFTGFLGLEIAGIPFNDIDSGAAFNLFHEGLHLGTITSIKDALGL